ncbi:MAG: flagellar motor protein MotB [Burkholderiales bacterium]
MANDSRPIVIRRIKKVSGGHHGGAWKIAYADFVTAMMAFFLLMWLLGSTAKGDLNGIAEYFRTPLKVALQGGSGSGDSSSVTRGGGQDLTRANGQVRRGDTPAERRTINLQAAKAEVAREETARLAQLKQRVESTLDANARLTAVRGQIRLDLTDEGLRIQIVDEQNRPMFDTGSARLKDYTREILREIATVLNGVDNRIALSGHTDAAPYSGGERGYSNWELSADRANASRRELLAAGLADDKVLRVVGLAASVPFGADGPLHPSNRRISIVVLNRQTVENLMQQAKENR